jgi:hypothetical protein
MAKENDEEAHTSTMSDDVAWLEHFGGLPIIQPFNQTWA